MRTHSALIIIHTMAMSTMMSFFLMRMSKTTVLVKAAQMEPAMSAMRRNKIPNMTA